MWNKRIVCFSFFVFKHLNNLIPRFPIVFVSFHLKKKGGTTGKGIFLVITFLLRFIQNLHKEKRKGGTGGFLDFESLCSLPQREEGNISLFFVFRFKGKEGKVE